MIKVQSIVVTPIMQNCRVIWDSSDKNAVVVDPGGDVAKVEQVLSREGLVCKEIWLTHSHFDHCGGVAELKQKTNAPLYASLVEKEMRGRVEDIAVMWGLDNAGMRNCPEPEHLLKEGDILSLGSHRVDVFDTPGHSPGHVVFYFKDQNLLICGDTIFQGAIGRTDLPGGDYEQLMRSVQEKILSLPDNTALMPGHGPDTTVGAEKRTNPFIR